MIDPLPTAAEQEACGLDSDMTDAIRVAIRESWPELFRRRIVTRVRRRWPRGVYADNSGLWTAFSRTLNGKHFAIRAGRGPAGDFSPETAQRLAQQCATAAAAWDATHRHKEDV